MPGAGGSATVSALSESAHTNSWASSSTAIRLLAGRAVTALQQSPAARVDPVMSDGGEMKNCPGCGLDKALSQFHRNKSKYAADLLCCCQCAYPALLEALRRGVVGLFGRQPAGMSHLLTSSGRRAGPTRTPPTARPAPTPACSASGS
jgi:hypothetical protein